jgi:hypothetical protein
MIFCILFHIFKLPSACKSQGLLYSLISEGKRPLVDLVEHGMILFKWILKVIGCGSEGWIILAHDRVQWRALVNTSDSIKGGEFLDQLTDYQLLKNDFL